MSFRLPHAAARSLFATAIAALAMYGCGGESTPAGGEEDPGSSGGASGQNGLDRGDGGALASETNPYGVAYPTEGIGTKARVGKTPGDRIKNMKFQGYPDGLPAGGMRPMKLADFYDPEIRNNIKLIHFQASGTWCTYCKQESDAVSPKLQAWREKGVVYILSMAEGPSRGVGAEVKDLDNWLKNHNLVTPAWLDSGNQQLGVFYDAAAMPWNATVDATTMEIIDSHMGFEGVPAIEANFTKWIAEIDARQ